MLILKQQLIKHSEITFRQINIENRPYYIFNDIINIKKY